MLGAGSVGYTMTYSPMAQSLSDTHPRSPEITIHQTRHRRMDDLSPPSSPSSTPPATPPANVPLAGATYNNELHINHSDLEAPQSHDSHYLLRTPSPGIYSTHVTHEPSSKAPSRHTHTTHRSKSSKPKSRSGEDNNLSMLMRLMQNSSVPESAEVTIHNLMESLRVAVLDRNGARAEVLSLQAQLNMYKWQMDQAQDEILRAQNIINTLAEEKRAGEEREAKLRGRAREAEALLRIRDAHQQGFQRGLHDAQRLAKHNLYVDHALYDDEVSKSTSADDSRTSRSAAVSAGIPTSDDLQITSSSRRSHNRRRSEPATTTRQSIPRESGTVNFTVDPGPSGGRDVSSPPVQTRPRTSSLAAHITPFPLNAETVPPVPLLPQVPMPVAPPPRPPTRGESRARSVHSDRTSPPPTAQPYQHDSFIPSLNANGRFTLPAPHSMGRPMSTNSVNTMRAAQEQRDQEDSTEQSSSSSSSTSADVHGEEERPSPSFPFPRQDHPGSSSMPPPRTRTQSVRSRASTRMSDYGLLAPVGRIPSQEGQSQQKVEEWRNALGFVPYPYSGNTASSGVPPPPVIFSDEQQNRLRSDHTERREPSPLPVPPPRRKMSDGKESSTSHGFAPSLNWLRNRFQTTRQESSATTVPQIAIEPPSHSASATSSARTHVNRTLLTPDPPSYSSLNNDEPTQPPEMVAVSPYPNIPPPNSYQESYEVAPLPEGTSHPPPPPRSGRRRGATVVTGGHRDMDSSRSAARRRAASVVSSGTAPLNRPISLFNSPVP